MERICAVNLQAVRACRLFHWLKLRDISKTLENKNVSGRMRALLEKEHGMHMRFVQSLNALFPIGDTAERDEADVS